MNITTITATVPIDKRKEALELIKKAASICNEKFSDHVTISVLQPTNGDFDRIIWTEQYESLAARAAYIDLPGKSVFMSHIKEAFQKGYITSRILNHYSVIDLAG